MPATTIFICLTIGLLSLTAKKCGLLTFGGSIAAALLGIGTVAFGGFQAIAVLLLFFASSNLLGLWHKNQKQSLGFEKGGARDQWQVLANGGPALIGLILCCLSKHQSAGIVLFTAGIAEAAADTWATEIGSAAGKHPVSVMTGKPVARGQSGGISWPGTIAAVAGALFIGLSSAVLVRTSSTLHVIVVTAMAGFCGAIVDSILGATLQAQFVEKSGRTVEFAENSTSLSRGIRWFRNDAVNFTAGAIAVLLAAATWWHS